MLEFLTVIGGLALFLFGVKMLSQGMEQLAGGRSRNGWIKPPTIPSREQPLAWWLRRSSRAAACSW